MSLGDRLLSRKFWLAVTAVLYFGAVGAVEQIAQVVIAYLAVQAGVDAFSSYQEQRVAPAPQDTAGTEPALEGPWTEIEITD